MTIEQKNLITALVLSGIILFGWQFWFNKGRPVSENSVELSKVLDTGSDKGQTVAQVTDSNGAPSSIDPSTAVGEVSKKIEISKNREFEYSTGQGLVDLKTEESSKRLKEILGEGNSGFQLEVGSNGQFAPLSIDPSNLILGQEILLPNGGSLLVSAQDQSIGLSLNLPSAQQVRLKLQAQPFSESGSKMIRQFVVHPSSTGRWDVGSEKDGESKPKWFGVDFNHNLFAVAIEDVIDFRYASSEAGQLLLTSAQPISSLKLKIFQAKKNYDLLVSLGNNLEQAVDFGMLWVISLPILRALQYSFKLIPNYGIGIILLTLLVRLLTYPLQYKSFVSMKKMQNLAPELAKIKEKHKEDQVKAQQESMELFKRTGVNPLGGCLPMILQMPVFFAFYRVLQESVELVGAPFYFWIKDLSHKDPFYVLPVLVGVVMLLNQKMTPSTSMDPVQKKVMMFMPIMFAFFMKDLPSGLNLYFFVSMLVGIAQQLYVYKKLESAK